MATRGAMTLALSSSAVTLEHVRHLLSENAHALWAVNMLVHSKYYTCGNSC